MWCSTSLTTMLSSQIVKILAYCCFPVIAIGLNIWFALSFIEGVLAIYVIFLPIFVKILQQEISYYRIEKVWNYLKGLLFNFMHFIFTNPEIALLICAYAFISIFLCSLGLPWNFAIYYSFIITFYGYLVKLNYYNIMLNYCVFKLNIKLNYWWITPIIFYTFILIIPFFLFDGLIDNFIYHYHFNDCILYMTDGGNPDPSGGNPDPSGGTGGTGPPNPNPELDRLATINNSVLDGYNKQYSKNRSPIYPHLIVDYDIPDDYSDEIRSYWKFANREEAESSKSLKNIAIFKDCKYYMLLKQHEVINFKSIGQDFNPFAYESISSYLMLDPKPIHIDSSTGVHTYRGVLPINSSIGLGSYSDVLDKQIDYTISLKNGKFMESIVKDSFYGKPSHFTQEEDFVTWWRTGGEICVNTKYSRSSEPSPFFACRKAFLVEQYRESARELVAKERGFNK